MLHTPHFPTDYPSILARMAQVKPSAYGKNRNFIDGDVTYLSPYISRGVISTKQVFKAVSQLGYAPSSIEKFIQELAWRDYWQQIWRAKGMAINSAIKQEQTDVNHHQISASINNAQTGIQAIDTSIQGLYDTGYMHNHMRMYSAMLSCHLGKNHWLQPAQWMYYYLLDGDWASNALSWQWVAGANSHKKYYANQDNINKYTKTEQTDTYLDVSYAQLSNIDCPTELIESLDLSLKTPLQNIPTINLNIDSSLPTCIYNYYNLDPQWRSERSANRLLLLEPAIFEAYPVSQKCLDFMLDLASHIDNIQIYIGSFEQLIADYNIDNNTVYYKEHPLNTHYQGNQDERDWISSVEGYYPSFFAFWKKVKKELYPKMPSSS